MDLVSLEKYPPVEYSAGSRSQLADYTCDLGYILIHSRPWQAIGLFSVGGQLVLCKLSGSLP